MENSECGENDLVQSYERQISHLEQYLSCKHSNEVVQLSIDKLTKALLELKKSGLTAEGEMVLLSDVEAERIWNVIRTKKLGIVNLTPLNVPSNQPPCSEHLMLKVTDDLNVMVWLAHEFLSRFNFLEFDSNYDRKKKYTYSVAAKDSSDRKIKYDFELEVTQEERHNQHVFLASLLREEKDKHGKKFAICAIPLDKIINFEDVVRDKLNIEYIFNELHQGWKRLWENLAQSRTPSISLGGASGN